MAASKWYSTPLHELQNRINFSALTERLPTLANRRKKQAVAGARALGWTSIALGLAELLMPRQTQQLMGVEDGRYDGIMRVLGIRELAHGASILTESTATPKLQVAMESRILGDVLDTALLAVAASKTRRPAGLLAVAAAVSVIGLLDMRYARQLRKD